MNPSCRVSTCSPPVPSGLVSVLQGVPTVWPEGWQYDTFEFSELSYADDAAFPIAGEAATLADKLRLTTEVIALEFTRFRLTLIMKPRKTEGLFNFIGKGANKHRGEMEAQGIRVAMGNGTVTNLSIVSRYVHVGSVAISANRVLPDVKKKSLAMKGGCKGGLRKLLEDPRLGLKSKFGLTNCSLLSKGLSSAGVWPQLTQAELSPFKGVVLRVYRIAAGIELGPANLSDDAVLGATGFPRPQALIEAERLSLLTRLIARPNRQVMTALAAATNVTTRSAKPRYWLGTAQETLRVVAGEGKQDLDMAESFMQKCQVIVENPVAYKLPCFGKP